MADIKLENTSSWKQFGGWNRRYKYKSPALGNTDTVRRASVLYRPRPHRASSRALSVSLSSALSPHTRERFMTGRPGGTTACVCVCVCVCELCRVQVFTVYLPPQAEKGPVPVVFYLSGLTCTDENFIQKAGKERYYHLH